MFVLSSEIAQLRPDRITARAFCCSFCPQTHWLCQYIHPRCR
nr:MAG TPA: hypothetical protein [Microviridae sp.]